MKPKKPKNESNIVHISFERREPLHVTYRNDDTERDYHTEYILTQFKLLGNPTRPKIVLHGDEFGVRTNYIDITPDQLEGVRKVLIELEE